MEGMGALRKGGMKSLYIFDLDGTLTESKMVLDEEMSSLLCRLLENKKAAVIGGGDFSQFQEQFLDRLHCNKYCLQNLLILPVSGASMYRCTNGGWEEVYNEILSVTTN